MDVTVVQCYAPGLSVVVLTTNTPNVVLPYAGPCWLQMYDACVWTYAATTVVVTVCVDGEE